MAKFVEALVDGLTVQGRVLRAGQRSQVRDEFPMQSKRDQTKRWGAPRYREISRSDYESAGGSVIVEEIEEKPVITEDNPPVDGGPFAEFDGLNVEDTLAKAAELDESEIAAFIVHEQEGANRKSVLAALGVHEDDE